MDMAYMGENDSVRKTFLYDYLSLAMHTLAKMANQVVISDALTITDDGSVTFKVGGVNIDDMFQPIRIVNVSDNVEVRKSNSYTFPTGWYWEGNNQPIFTRGLTGASGYALHYIKYPAWITSGTQIPEFPPSGYQALIYECAALIKQSKNFYEESNAMKDQAKASYGPIMEASNGGE